MQYIFLNFIYLHGTSEVIMTDNKTKIIDAAEEIMSQKGLEGSSITEIAKKAGVAESLIYNYFKGKEDILPTFIQCQTEIH